SAGGEVEPGRQDHWRPRQDPGADRPDKARRHHHHADERPLASRDRHRRRRGQGLDHRRQQLRSADVPGSVRGRARRSQLRDDLALVQDGGRPMKYAAGGVTVRAGEPATVEVAVAAPAAKTDTGGKRLRVSGWMDHPATAYGRWIDVKTGKFQEDHSMIEAARGALDDITFLSGIWMSKTRGVTWRVDSVPGFLQKAIDVCHQNDVQIFLGYSIADEGGMIG